MLFAQDAAAVVHDAAVGVSLSPQVWLQYGAIGAFCLFLISAILAVGVWVGRCLNALFLDFRKYVPKVVTAHLAFLESMQERHIEHSQTTASQAESLAKQTTLIDRQTDMMSEQTLVLQKIENEKKEQTELLRQLVLTLGDRPCIAAESATPSQRIPLRMENGTR